MSLPGEEFVGSQAICRDCPLTVSPYFGVTGVSHCGPNRSSTIRAGVEAGDSAALLPSPCIHRAPHSRTSARNTFKSIAEHAGSDVRFSVGSNSLSCVGRRGWLGQGTGAWSRGPALHSARSLLQILSRCPPAHLPLSGTREGGRERRKKREMIYL